MASDQDRGLLYRTILIIAFPPLKIFFLVLDIVCFIFQQVGRCIGRVLKLIYRIIETSIKGVGKSLEILGFAPLIKYQRLKEEGKTKPRQENDRKEPLPYEDDFWRRFLTHTGGLLLGLVLYVFVYIVLIKHHTVITVSVAFLLMLPYMLVLENSHAIRAIVMLSLPIMFTNRGRALVFCCMLAIMVSGPLKNSQVNISELHKSLNCSKQYLIVKTDKYVEENVVKKLMRAEQIIEMLANDIKQFAKEVKQRVQVIIQLALTVDKYIREAIEELKKIVNICNSHSPEYIANCERATSRIYWECKRNYGHLFGMFCELARFSGREYCQKINWPASFCEISRKVIVYMASEVGERLKAAAQAIEDMLYVDVDTKHVYYYNGTKSKSFKKVISEVKFDVEQKFWYIHLVARLFNLVTLILVIWITLTATLYHMHYMEHVSFDNMYIDKRLVALDDRRKQRIVERKEKLAPNNKLARRLTTSVKSSYTTIFPLTKKHEHQYLKPFGIWMNEMERHKLLIAGLVWMIIVNYITFFVALDFGLYHLIELINQILNDILFKSDLPLIDVSSGSGKEIVHYNRTYLSRLREKNRSARIQRLTEAGNSTKGVGGMYRRFMNSVEKNIPDDVMILDSLQECLPRSSHPNFRNYKKLAYLAALTFGGVILEAYALRLRHWIANLFYPKRANKRTLWLYRKILTEKPKYERDHKAPELLAAELIGRAIKK